MITAYRYCGSAEETDSIVFLANEMQKTSSRYRDLEFNETRVREILNLAATNPDEYCFFVAMSGNIAVGFIGLAISENFLNHGYTAFDLGFYVLPYCLDKDAGELLLNLAIWKCDVLKVPLVMSSSTGINPEIYGRYLRKFGFAERGRSWERPKSALQFE